jgi:hypothetical protein
VARQRGLACYARAGAAESAVRSPIERFPEILETLFPALVTELPEVLGRADTATLEKLFGSSSTPVNTPLFAARRRSRRRLPTRRLLSCPQSAARSGRSPGLPKTGPCRAKMGRARLPHLAAASIGTPAAGITPTRVDALGRS